MKPDIFRLVKPTWMQGVYVYGWIVKNAISECCFAKICVIWELERFSISQNTLTASLHWFHTWQTHLKLYFEAVFLSFPTAVSQIGLSTTRCEYFEREETSESMHINIDGNYMDTNESTFAFMTVLGQYYEHYIEIMKHAVASHFTFIAYSVTSRL